MINGRAKGHAFERQIIKIFQEEFGECADHLKRVLDQYQQSGRADIEFYNLRIECKRYAKGAWHHPEWWRQCCNSTSNDLIPVLIYKFDRHPIRCVFRLCDIGWGGGFYPSSDASTATTDLQDGIMVMRDLLEF